MSAEAFVGNYTGQFGLTFAKVRSPPPRTPPFPHTPLHPPPPTHPPTHPLTPCPRVRQVRDIPQGMSTVYAIFLVEWVVLLLLAFYLARFCPIISSFPPPFPLVSAPAPASRRCLHSRSEFSLPPHGKKITIESGGAN